MNHKDMKIISQLRNDARMSLTKMSRKTKIPVSTIFDRLKENENNLILKHTSLIDFSKLGYHTRANITISVEREDKEALQAYLKNNQSVNSLYRINNGFDFMIEGIFEKIVDLEDFLDNIEHKFKIKDKKSFFVIEDLKREAFMTSDFLIV